VQAQGTPEEHYNIGFSDGCNDVHVAGHHTSDYLAGYSSWIFKRVIKRVPQAQAYVGRYPDLLLPSIKEIKSGPSMMIY
jgi:hypothetical protein